MSARWTRVMAHWHVVGAHNADIKESERCGNSIALTRRTCTASEVGSLRCHHVNSRTQHKATRRFSSRAGSRVRSLSCREDGSKGRSGLTSIAVSCQSGRFPTDRSDLAVEIPSLMTTSARGPTLLMQKLSLSDLYLGRPTNQISWYCIKRYETTVISFHIRWSFSDHITLGAWILTEDSLRNSRDGFIHGRSGCQ